MPSDKSGPRIKLNASGVSPETGRVSPDTGAARQMAFRAIWDTTLTHAV